MTLDTAAEYRSQLDVPCTELLPALGCQAVVLGAALVLGEVPVGVDEAAVLHAVERRIERAVFDLQNVVGGEVNPFGHAEPVHRPPREGLEDHDIERALKEPEVGGRTVGSRGRHGLP